MTEAPAGVEESDARAIVERVAWPYVFWRPIEPYEKEGNWLEREVKRALLSELRRGLESEEHPLQAQGIAALPVDRAAEATTDPVELLAIVQEAAHHCLRYADEGLSARDWEYSVRRATGERLALRLSRIAKEKLTTVLELLLSKGQRPVSAKARAAAGASLQSVGLGLWVEDSIAFGPLARQVRDEIVHGVLLERLETTSWPTEGQGQELMQRREAPLDKGGGGIPVTRAAGPAVFRFGRLLGSTIDRICQIPPPSEDAGQALRELFIQFPTSVWDFVAVQDDLAGLMRRLGRAMRMLEQIKSKDRKWRTIVALARLLVKPVLTGLPSDLGAYLRRMESYEKRLLPGPDAGLTLCVANILVLFCASRDQLSSLLQAAVSRFEERNREKRWILRAWGELETEVERLLGHATRAMHRHEKMLDGSNADSPYLARALREAGYSVSAIDWLPSLSGKIGDGAGAWDIDHGITKLEQGHIERDRGAVEQACSYYRRAHDEFISNGFPGLAMYADVYEASARVEANKSWALEPRLREIREIADELGEHRLLFFVDLVLGDIEVLTGRLDAALMSYRNAYGGATQLGDDLALASALDKQAYLQEVRGHADHALVSVMRASTLEIGNGRHSYAARLLERAGTLAEQLDQLGRARSCREQAEQQRRLARALAAGAVE
ncbi:MAG: hypothetical protein AAGF11_02395 [Myxococcota bacterium]